MRRISSSLAALLSLLLIPMSASASVCDLPCSFHQMHPGCQPPNHQQLTNRRRCPSPPGMDMGSDQSEGMKGPDASTDTIPDHSNSMSFRMEMAGERFERAAKPETGTNVTLDHSKAVSSCIQEPCSQIPASFSPSTRDRSQPSSLHWIAVSILSHLNLYISIHRIRLETPPLIIRAAGCLTTTLRI